MRPLISSAALAFALAAPSLAAADTWDIDSANSAASFSVRHLMVANVRGQFGSVSGTINWDTKDIAKSSVEATIDASTINTRQEKRDAHLKSPDFLDVAKFPTITFKSKKVTAAGVGKAKVVGDLTLHGVTKEVKLDVEGPVPSMKDPWGNQKSGLTATTKINRLEFGLTWNKPLEAGGVTVGQEVAITIDVEMSKRAAAAPAK